MMNVFISKVAVVSDGEVRGAMVVWHRDNSFLCASEERIVTCK